MRLAPLLLLAACAAPPKEPTKPTPVLVPVILKQRDGTVHRAWVTEKDAALLKERSE